MALRVGSGVPQFVQQVTLNPSSINANSVSVETFTVTGITLDTMYRVDALALEAGCFLIGARPAASNSLELSIWNSTNGAIDPASQTFRVVGF